MATLIRNSFGALGLFVGAMALMPAAASAGTICDLRTQATCDAATLASLGQSYVNGVAQATSGALFFTDEQHPAGTGYIDSFARVQQIGWEQG